MPDETIKLLRDLIAIDSVNPSLVLGGAGENQIAEAVATHMRESGLDVSISEVAPGRKNVVGVLTAKKPGPSLMLCGHTDTVGIEGMKSPFDPVERNGKIYGRGSGDMKGGLAAMLSTARILAQENRLSKGKLIVAAVADEEYASIGAEALIKDWNADAAIIGEPTDLAIAVSHKGFSWLEISTEGRAAHGSRPQEGRDAILHMGRVLKELEELGNELSNRAPHPQLGHPSLHASIIHGGRELCTYPDTCLLQIERRNVPGEATGIAMTELQRILVTLHSEDNEFAGTARMLFERPPYEIPEGNPLPTLLESAVRQNGHDTMLEGMTYWTDAAILAQAGIPSVIFGPGGDGYHGLEEYVWADQVVECRNVLLRFVQEFCTA